MNTELRDLIKLEKEERKKYALDAALTLVTLEQISHQDLIKKAEEIYEFLIKE